MTTKHSHSTQQTARRPKRCHVSWWLRWPTRCFYRRVHSSIDARLFDDSRRMRINCTRLLGHQAGPSAGAETMRMMAPDVLVPSALMYSPPPHLALARVRVSMEMASSSQHVCVRVYARARISRARSMWSERESICRQVPACVYMCNKMVMPRPTVWRTHTKSTHAIHR